MNVNWLTPVKRRTVSVLGEGGSFVADLIAGDLFFFNNADVGSEWDQIAQVRGVSEGDMTRFAFPKREPLAGEHEAFRRGIREGAAEGLVTLGEGVQILEVAERMLASSR
jgi:predicted dehydrogenase